VRDDLVGDLITANNNGQPSEGMVYMSILRDKEALYIGDRSPRISV
jgi:hypothetical protein